jgi:hypothetical protein
VIAPPAKWAVAIFSALRAFVSEWFLYELPSKSFGHLSIGLLMLLSLRGLKGRGNLNRLQR